MFTALPSLETLHQSEDQTLSSELSLSLRGESLKERGHLESQTQSKIVFQIKLSARLWFEGTYFEYHYCLLFFWSNCQMCPLNQLFAQTMLAVIVKLWKFFWPPFRPRLLWEKQPTLVLIVCSTLPSPTSHTKKKPPHPLFIVSL